MSCSVKLGLKLDSRNAFKDSHLKISGLVSSLLMTNEDNLPCMLQLKDKLCDDKVIMTKRIYIYMNNDLKVNNDISQLAGTERG